MLTNQNTCHYFKSKFFFVTIGVNFTPIVNEIVYLSTLFDTFTISFKLKNLIIIDPAANKNSNHVDWSKLHVNWLQGSRKLVRYARKLVNYSLVESINTLLQSRKILISIILKTNTREINAS